MTFAVVSADANAYTSADLTVYQLDIAAEDLGRVIREYGVTTAWLTAGLFSLMVEHRLDDLAENITRRLLSYALGRDLTTADRPTVQRLLRDAAPGGYKLRDLVVAICATEAFLQRSNR